MSPRWKNRVQRVAGSSHRIAGRRTEVGLRDAVGRRCGSAARRHAASVSVGGPRTRFSSAIAPVRRAAKIVDASVSVQPCRTPVDDDGRLEDRERRRDDLGFDLTEDRPAAREVRGPVGHRDVAELPGLAANSSCSYTVTFRAKKWGLSNERLEPGHEGPGPDAELSVVDHGRTVASPGAAAPACRARAGPENLEVRDPGNSWARRSDRASQLVACVARVAALQERLRAEGSAVLLVLQGDRLRGRGRHDQAGIHRSEPAGRQRRGVPASRRSPSSSTTTSGAYPRRIPAPSTIDALNRSHYEDVVTASVLGLITSAERKRRIRQVHDFEGTLMKETTVVKVFLHLSKEEQRKRLQARIDDPGQDLLEVPTRRPREPPPLGRVRPPLRRGHQRHFDARRAVVRRPGRPQVGERTSRRDPPRDHPGSHESPGPATYSRPRRGRNRVDAGGGPKRADFHQGCRSATMDWR